ncbi:MFS transporter [Sphingobacteriales bacterium UPWRP_1]|nr:MFS transporter [Sphingobacteriales bacterium TSM_CSM]PSJ77044.1 MFS transporter [Sphingobacteriales bacterium UPWRP_1]
MVNKSSSGSAKLSLGTIFFTVFLDLVGVGIVLPVTVPLLLNPQSALLPVHFSEAYRTIILGFLIASYPVASFFGGPILGALSDKYGRRRLLLLSLAGTCLGYLVFALGIYVGSIYLLFLSRIIDGFTGGNISIVQSSIADISDDASKAKNFGLIGMAFGVGFIIGPFLGGKLSDPNLLPWFNYDTPFLFAALLSLVNIALVVRNFSETLPAPVNRPINAFTGIKNLQQAFTDPRISILFAAVFFYNLGFSFFTQFFQVFLVKRFGFNQSGIGDYFAYIGFCIALVQGIVVRRLAVKYRPQQILRYSLPGLAVALFCVMLPQHAWQLYLISPFIALFQGSSAPNTTSLVSQNALEGQQGKMLGINQSVLAMGLAIPPVVAGFIDTIDVRLPLIAASGSVLLGYVLMMRFLKK